MINDIAVVKYESVEQIMVYDCMRRLMTYRSSSY